MFSYVINTIYKGMVILIRISLKVNAFYKPVTILRTRMTFMSQIYLNANHVLIKASSLVIYHSLPNPVH